MYRKAAIDELDVIVVLQMRSVLPSGDLDLISSLSLQICSVKKEPLYRID